MKSSLALFLFSVPALAYNDPAPTESALRSPAFLLGVMVAGMVPVVAFVIWLIRKKS